MASVYKLAPLHYVHVTDNNTCEVITLLGPLSFTLYSYHHVQQETPQPCVIVPPGHYVKVHNPVHRFASSPREKHNEVTSVSKESGDNSACGFELISGDPDHQLRCPGYVEVKSGCFEYRFAQTPFPLFPGEIAERVLPMTLLKSHEALLIRVLENYNVTTTTTTTTIEHHPKVNQEHEEEEETEEENSETRESDLVHKETPHERTAGEMYVFKGPGLYTPRVEEIIVKPIQAMNVNSQQLLHLQANALCVDAQHITRVAGEEWSEAANGLYFLPPYIHLISVLEPVLIEPSKALKVKALSTFHDHRYFHVDRAEGDEWLITHEMVGNTFTPLHCEVIVETIELLTLNRREYVIIRNPFHHGQYDWGKEEICRGPVAFFVHPREVLVHDKIHSCYLLDPNEALLVQAINTFTEERSNNNEENEENEEEDENANTNNNSNDSSNSNNNHKIIHKAASRWLIHGPCTYFPPLNVRVLERRCLLALNKAEGVYVRNVRTGEIRSEYGKPFMLSENEELWAKPVSTYVQSLLQAPNLSLRVQEVNDAMRRVLLRGEDSAEMGSLLISNRRTTILNVSVKASPSHEDQHNRNIHSSSSSSCSSSSESSPEKELSESELNNEEKCIDTQPSDLTPYRMISANIGANSLVRLYDVSTGQSRVEVGPTVVLLRPHEEFTPLALSGGRPKRARQIHTLKLYLGPDYMSDIIEVETLDHARPKLHVAYNWEFDTSDMDRIKEVAFTIPDFVSEACKCLASRIRAVIASVNFENFHRNSLSLIRHAVFDSNSSDRAIILHDEALYFVTNGLRITNVDLQSVEPVDFKTQIALTKSVQLAVEIITRAQENDASHHAALIEQEAHGQLELQVMHDAARAEEQRQILFTVMAHNAASELKGSLIAQHAAEAQARELEAQTDVQVTPIRCEAHELTLQAELDILLQRMESDLQYQRELNNLDVNKVKALAEIEAHKHEELMSIIGMDTLTQLALAGPELQQKLLSALGLQGYLITNGTTPINLLSAAKRITNSSSGNNSNNSDSDNGALTTTTTTTAATKQNNPHIRKANDEK